MYAGVVYFADSDDVKGYVVSDGRPLKTARKYTFRDKTIVLRAHEADGGFQLRVTKNSLGGEALFEDVVPEGQYTRIDDGFGRFWVISLSKDEFEVDATDQGAWIDEHGRLRASVKCTNYEGMPERELSELIAPIERPTPAAKEATEIDGKDIRYIKCSDGGFFEGDSNLEAWYDPQEGCYKARFWHSYGGSLSRSKAMKINVPDKISVDEMDGLISVLLGLGLANTYSFYTNREILDGGGWSLSIETRDGYHWHWGGYNAYPRGWDAARNAICALLLGYPKKTPHGGHAAFIADFHGSDGDWGRTEVAHLYRHGVGLESLDDSWIPEKCFEIRQDLLLYRRTRRSKYEYRTLNEEQFAEVMGDVEKGLARRRAAGELMGAIGYIIDNDDAEQTFMNELARKGTLGKILCNVRIKDKAAPGLAIAGWDV